MGNEIRGTSMKTTKIGTPRKLNHSQLTTNVHVY